MTESNLELMEELFKRLDAIEDTLTALTLICQSNGNSIESLSAIVEETLEAIAPIYEQEEEPD